MTEAVESKVDFEYMQPFTIKACHIVNQEGFSNNISGITSVFHIYESVESKFLTGDMIVTDGINLLKNFRFTGQEYLRISICHGNEEGPVLDMTFRIYKLSRIVKGKEIIQAYQFHFCDPSVFLANTTRLSKVYRGSYSEMLFKVLNKDMGLPVNLIGHWEDTERDNNQFLCPNWTANKLMNHFTINADKGTNSAWRNGMFLYQTMTDGFNFKSIDNMCSGVTTPEFREDGKTTNEVHKFFFKPTSSAKDSPSRNQILDVKRPQVFDVLAGSKGGAYASRLYAYDSVRKLESDEYYDIEDTFNRGSSHVSEYPMIRTESMLTISNGHEQGLTTGEQIGDEYPPVNTVPHQTLLAPNNRQDDMVVYSYSSNHDFDNKKKVGDKEVWSGEHITDNSKLERKGLKQILNQNRVQIIIPVRTDVSVGNIVELMIPEPELQDEKSDTKDKIVDNRYLIVDMCLSANVQLGVGSLQLECVKESFAQKITEEAIQGMIDNTALPVNRLTDRV